MSWENGDWEIFTGSRRTDEMVQLRRQGETLKTIGDRYGLTRERVRQILKSVGEPMPEVRNLKSLLKRDISKSELKRLYESKKPLAEIAKHFNATSGTISHRLKMFGIPKREPIYKVKPMERLYDDVLTKDFLYQQYVVNNKTIAEISNDTGISVASVFNYLKRYGLNLPRLEKYQKRVAGKQWKRFKK